MTGHKNRSYLKLIIDLIMAITFVLLLNKTILGGLPFHEIAGTLIGLVFIVHVFFNWRWVVEVTGNFFRRGVPGRTRLSYGLNCVLLIAMAFIIISGVLVSKVLFPGIHIADRQLTTWAHIGVSFLILVVVGVHVGLHWGWITMVFKKIIGADTLFAKLPRWVSILTVLALLVAGGIQVNQTHYFSKVALMANLLSGKGGETEHGRGEERGFDGHQEGRHREEWHGEERDGEALHGEGRHFREMQREGEHRGEGGQRFERVSPWGVLGSYLSIMAIFVIATVYIEKWLRRRLSARLP